MRLLVLAGLALVGCSGDESQDRVDRSDEDNDGVSSAEGDCNDQDPTIFPGADDIVGDDIDQNCDQSDGVDADGDRDPSQGSGGGDCDDANPEISSMTEEIGWDGIDQNCDLVDQFDFADVCGGRNFSCGVSTVGDIHCWGTDQDGVVSNRPLEGRWTQIDCGEEFACALEYSGEVRCWGNDEDQVVSDTPPVTKVSALQIAAGIRHVCLVSSATNQVQCWGDDNAISGLGGFATPVRELALGDNYTCFALLNGGSVDCRGTEPPATIQTMAARKYDNEEWISISGGNGFICGIYPPDQRMRCYSDDLDGGLQELNPLDDQGPYSQMDSYGDWSCGIIEATELSCWGSEGNPVASNPQLSGQPGPDISVSRVGLGRRHACAIKNEDGELLCWGEDLAGETILPNFAGYAGD
ncbi:MAG: MopE-related protein [Myxococcota bacterium]